MERPKFCILRNVQFRHICGGISFWSNFGRPKIWVFPCWVTTPHGCHWPQLTNSGRQFQQWSLFTFKQYCLEGILAKESSPRTKDFLLWRDLQKVNLLLYWRSKVDLLWWILSDPSTCRQWIRCWMLNNVVSSFRMNTSWTLQIIVSTFTFPNNKKSQQI